MKKAIIAIVFLSVFAIFAGTAMATEPPSVTGEKIYLTQASVGDSIPTFMINEPEHGILPPEYATINPITYHQPDVDFNAYYSTVDVNSPEDLWPTTE